MTNIDEVHKALTALEFENVRLMKIPTWPWRPGTFRGVHGAILLLIILWLIQFTLGRLLT